MIEILGTCHNIQYKPKDATAREIELMDGLESIIRQLVRGQKVKLLAEEGLEGFPLTTARRVAEEECIRYEQVDIFGHDLDLAGIRPELQARERAWADLDKWHADQLRFPRADDIRENLWLDKIEKASVECVLLVCGWAHARPLSRKVKGRSCKAAEVMFFPESLQHSTIVDLYLDAQGVVCASRHSGKA